MILYSESKDYKLYHGSMLDMLEHISPNSIDSVVTDPPYELNFMGKGWDNSGIAFQPSTWEKCYQVLKPGGYLLAFGGSRTFHRIACAIEDAGFEIRDTIMWLYGSGFPKSMNIGLAMDKKNGVESPVIGQNESILKKQAKDLREGHRKVVDSLNAGAEDRNNGFKTVSADIKEAQNQWKGWGTCLKPSFEPIIIARKPFTGSLLDNIVEYGVGGLNIDECRVGTDKLVNKGMSSLGVMHDDNWVSNTEVVNEVTGRFPANTILTYDETDYDEVCGGFPVDRGYKPHQVYSNTDKYEGYGSISHKNGEMIGYGDSGSASRYFYCAKASKKDRNNGEVKNNHPTVKPCELMQYLVRLVTPNGGIVLDPFNGSGSTGKAVMYENRERNKGYTYIGIELTEEYLPISKARIEYPMIGEITTEKVVEKKIDTKPKTNEVTLW